jgi:hypothetical protein
VWHLQLVQFSLLLRLKHCLKQKFITVGTDNLFEGYLMFVSGLFQPINCYVLRKHKIAGLLFNFTGSGTMAIAELVWQKVTAAIKM